MHTHTGHQSLSALGSHTLLAVATLTIMVGCVIVPGLPAVAAQLGVGSGGSWLVTLPALGVVLFGPAAARLMERAGLRRALMLGLFLYGLLGAAGRDGEALMLARGLAIAKEATADDWQVFGDQLIAAKQPAEAAIWYERVTRADPPIPWAAWLQYGGALDQAGRAEEADAALAKAVQLGPDEPLALNYLGYARIERGKDVPASLALLEKASKLDPDNASIIDSLGWGYYKAGQTNRALPLIESAAMAEPANSEINDHLGDIYWALGRHYEARYAWRAAALTAEADAQVKIAAKLAR